MVLFLRYGYCILRSGNDRMGTDDVLFHYLGMSILVFEDAVRIEERPTYLPEIY